MFSIFLLLSLSICHIAKKVLKWKTGNSLIHQRDEKKVWWNWPRYWFFKPNMHNIRPAEAFYLAREAQNLIYLAYFFQMCKNLKYLALEHKKFFLARHGILVVHLCFKPTTGATTTRRTTLWTTPSLTSESYWLREMVRNWDHLSGRGSRN
jgi:hypothetical protein